MQITLSEKPSLKPILVFVLIVSCVVLTTTVLQGDVLAEDKEAGWFNSDSARSSLIGGYEGYTRVISTLLVVIALIIATAYILRKKYGVRANLGRNKKYIQVVDHAPMGVKKSVFLVKVPGKHLLLGVTNERIELITEIANEDITGDKSADVVNKKEFIDLFKKSISGRKQE